MTLIRAIFSLFRQTFVEFDQDNVPRLAAALAYYIAFTIAPVLVLGIAVAGFVLQGDILRREVLEFVTNTVGEETSMFVSQLIDNVQRPGSGVLSTVLGGAALLLGALGAFEQLKDALNTVWNVPKTERRMGLRGFFINKAISLGMVSIISILLIVSLILRVVLVAIKAYTLSILPGIASQLDVMNWVLSYVVVILLFTTIFRFLPDVRLGWRDVWLGGIITMILFNLGNSALGFYLANSAVASIYGVAGSFVIIMLWIYYSSLIVLFGAEFTKVYAKHYGSLRVNLSPPKLPPIEKPPVETSIPHHSSASSTAAASSADEGA